MRLNKCATHEICVVLQAMRRNKHATHVTFVVLKAMRRNKRATHVTFVVLKAMRPNKRATHEICPFADIFQPLDPQPDIAIYFLSVSQTDTQRVRCTLVTATRLHRIRWSPFADIFHPNHNSTLLYVY